MSITERWLRLVGGIVLGCLIGLAVLCAIALVMPPLFYYLDAWKAFWTR